MIAHADIKTENILFMDNKFQDSKIIDFACVLKKSNAIHMLNLDIIEHQKLC
jgi:Ser/Thr protein kinase RdoA (MazF antagonist)